MSIIYNGTTIPNTGIIRYNNTSLNKVIYRGTTVWEKLVTSTVTYNGTGWRVYSDGEKIIGGTSDSSNRVDVIYTRTCTGNIVKFTDSSKYLRITANINCTVSISYYIEGYASDAYGWYSFNHAIYINGSRNSYIMLEGYYLGTDSMKIYQGTKSINLNTGQNLAIYMGAGNEGDSRTNYTYRYTLTCTAR